VTPNPTARPFILGALLFLLVMVAKPVTTRAGQDLRSCRPCSAIAAESSASANADSTMASAAAGRQ
jgi:hypothetical protein